MSESLCSQDLAKKIVVLEMKYAQSRRAAEKYKSALEKTREKNLSLVESLNAGVARSLPGRKGHYTEVNQAMVDILGYSRSELFGMNIYKLFADPAQAGALAGEMRDKGHVRERELVLAHKEGRPVIIHYTAKQVPPENGGPGFVDEIIHDITLRKKNEEELQKAEKLKSIGKLAGGIAHNFNNIMTGLYGNLSLARMELNHEPGAMAYLDKAEASMQEATKLTRQLLTFAKGGVPVKKTFDIHALVRDTAVFNLSGSSVRLEMSAREGLWPVHADRAQVNQVIANVVLNARQAMPVGGVLRIEMENAECLKDNLLTIKKGPHVVIRFIDQGEGIHNKDLKRIFDPYFTTREDADGMGLAVCYSIMRKHNGHIDVFSQKGKGTTFTLHLPAVPEKAERPAVAPPNPARSEKDEGSARVLVMDDEEHIRLITQKIMEKFGHDTVTTPDGDAAVKAYRNALEEGAPFDLVIMDLIVPGGMGGEEATRHILDLNPEAVVVVASGYSSDPIISDPGSYGFKGAMAKPFRLDDLERVLGKYIAMNRPET